jgi:hypothetical protein
MVLAGTGVRQAKTRCVFLHAKRQTRSFTLPESNGIFLTYIFDSEFRGVRREETVDSGTYGRVCGPLIR